MPECCARKGGLAAKEQFVLSQLLSQKIITANNGTRATVCAEKLICCKALRTQWAHHVVIGDLLLL